jgi:serine/threonine protein phosphatase 1
MATYVISDIHGYYSRFIDLLQQIEFDDGVDELYILGDCFDRGPQNKEMLD